MISKSILKVLLMLHIICGVIAREENMEEKINEAESNYVLAGEYCNMDEFGEMDYYLFCHT